MLDERRFFEGAEIRMTTDSGKPVFEIQAIVFDKWSQNLGGFVETVKRSAWDSADTTDIRGLFNHDPNFVLGRTKAGTMQIDVRSDSAWGIVTPPDTQWAKDLAISVDRGDISGSSFGFRSIKGTDKWDLSKPVAERTVTQFQIVRDFSVVTYPAYQQTNAKFALRSAINAFIEHPEQELPEELRHQIQKLGLEIPTVERQSEESQSEQQAPLPVTGHARRVRLLSLQNTH